jgi:protein phosphatase
MVESYGFSDPGRVRRNNEDNYLVDPDLHLYLVADGMGGAQGGETASRMAVDTVRAFIKQAPARSADALIESFQAANAAVHKKATSTPTLTGMGTTLVGVLDCGGQLEIASVGDSRLYKLDSTGFSQVTRDQTWINEVGRKLGFNENQLRTHPMRHVLTMAVGTSSSLRINQHTLQPEPGMILLLCSDGLHGQVSDEAMERTLGQPHPLQVICRHLIDLSLEAGAPDNITALLLRWPILQAA